MAARKLNVLVYTETREPPGTGSSVESVKHCLLSLRHLLSPNYAVIPISEAVILKEPWAATCALLVFPGGADLGYCRVLNGDGNRRIADYVRRGGSYLGLCAGGYYGSRRCEFEVGNKPLEVIGARELAFFPGTNRGAAFKGFQYHSEAGARAVRLRIASNALGDDSLPEETVSYFNGGGVFVDAAAAGSQGVEVLATYDEDIDVDGGDGKAAVVLCSIGKGKVILTGPHPEFAAANLNPQPSIPGYEELVAKLAANDRSRLSFLNACLSKLGLEVNHGGAAIPPLSSLHLSSLNHIELVQLLQSWEDIIDQEDGQKLIKGEGNVFNLQDAESYLDVDSLRTSLSGMEKYTNNGYGFTGADSASKKIIAHGKEYPQSKHTPQFKHGLYYSSLDSYRQQERDARSWGSVLMYGEVLMSTNTLLEKNPKLLGLLPTGFTLSATTQLAGRGRGTNVWIAPPGSLLFSTVINHPAHLAVSRPIVFIQYIAAIAIVEAVQSYAQGYENAPIKLKWPNDIYALDPNSSGDSPSYVKIGGILSQCAYIDGAYQIVLGIGINATNPRPTTSISDVVPSGAPSLHIETLLARILTKLEAIHTQFIRQGFSENLEKRYYRHWLHSGQAITLEAEGGVKARVVGITRDWGMLRVEETDSRGRGTGKMWALQSDENSFDYWKGLVRRKL